MPFYTDTPDTIIMNATLEGRNLLARIKFGSEMIFKAVGWQLGRGGYQYANPVKVEPLIDNANQSVGFIAVLDNTDWEAGDQIVLNGKAFIRGTHWNEGITLQQTVLNIKAAVLDSKDSRHYRLVNVDIDPGNDHRLRFTSTVTGNVLGQRAFNFLPADVDVVTDTITLANHGFVGAVQVHIDTTGTLPTGIALATNYYICNVTTNTFQISSTLNTPNVVNISTPGTGIHSVVGTGNLFPLNHLETQGIGDTTNFLVTPMSLATSTTLIDPAYPVPPTLGTFSLPDGRIEQPSASSISFVMRVPDGAVGMNAYGEIGLWVQVLESRHPMEIGRQVLFAHGHYPIQAKTDRSLFTFRVIVNF